MPAIGLPIQFEPKVLIESVT